MTNQNTTKRVEAELLQIIATKHGGLGLCENMFNKTIIPFLATAINQAKQERDDYWEKQEMGKSSDCHKHCEEARQEAIEEMIALSDEIEVKYGTPDIQEWRAFKGFRNTMRDRLKPTKQII